MIDSLLCGDRNDVDAGAMVREFVSVLDHLEEWIKLNMSDGLKPFQESHSFAKLCAKEVGETSQTLLNH